MRTFRGVRGACLLRQVVRRQHDQGTQPPDDPAAQSVHNWQGIRKGFAAARWRVNAQVVRGAAAMKRPPNR